MTFARTKLMIQDNCFEEEPSRLELNYIGPNPQRLYDKTYDLLKVGFRIGDSDIQEDEYTWGKGKIEKFKVRWWVHKDLDKFSYLWIRVRLAGEGDEKSGTAKIDLKPMLRTEYPQDTVWQKSILYEMVRTMWHRMFYHRQRFDYAEECRHMTITYQHQMQEFFKQLRERYG